MNHCNAFIGFRLGKAEIVKLAKKTSIKWALARLKHGEVYMAL